MQTLKLHKLDCGLHYGVGTVCRKCASGITEFDIKHQHDRALVASLESAPQSLQERAIESAHRYNAFRR